MELYFFLQELSVLLYIQCVGVLSGNIHLHPSYPEPVLEEQIHGHEAQGGEEVEDDTQADVHPGEADVQHRYPAAPRLLAVPLIHGVPVGHVHVR